MWVPLISCAITAVTLTFFGEMNYTGMIAMDNAGMRQIIVTSVERNDRGTRAPVVLDALLYGLKIPF